MNKLLIIFGCLTVVLLLAPLIRSSSGKDFSDRFEMLEDLEVEDQEFEEDPSCWDSPHVNKVVVNVDGLGAVGDGVSDDTQV